MADVDDDDKTEPLGMWPRALIGTVGLGLSVAGLIAVFMKDTNVAGVPLLIVAGAAFLYVALTGQRLLQVTKDGVTFARAKRLERALREATTDPDLPAEAKERLVDIAEDNGIRLAHHSAMELETTVREAFERIGQNHGFTVAKAIGPHDSGSDFVLSNAEKSTVAVEVKSRLRLSQFAAAVRRLRSTNWDSKMLVVDGAFPDEFAEGFRREGISIVSWSSEDETRVIAELRRMGFIRA